MLVAGAAVGCSPTVGYHGRSRVTAEHELGTLDATLPGTITVGAAAAAGEATLRSRGYVIVADRRTKGLSTVTGRRPARGLWRHISRTATFEARVGSRGVDVSVTIRPLGDEAEARAILGDALALLDA